MRDNTPATEIKLHERRQRQRPQRTKAYEVTFRDGTKRIKLLDDDDAEVLRDSGAKLKVRAKGRAAR